MFSFAFFFARSRAVVSVTTFFCAHDVCLCVCVFVRVCSFILIHLFARHVCMCVNACLRACVRVCVCVYVSECARARVRNVGECLISFFFARSRARQNACVSSFVFFLARSRAL